MQFHHHGYVSGDPRVQPEAETRAEGDVPEQVDVLIVGAGPAGLIAAAQLSQFPGITTRVVERREGRLQVGQADGIQARSVETFQAFGFANRIIDEAFQITTMAFWKPDPDAPDRIVRTTRTEDDPSAISEFPHLIVNQARVQDYLLEVMANSPSRLEPNYGLEFVDLEVAAEREYPVSVSLVNGVGEATGQRREVHAKYVVGADGARSAVRRAIGRRLEGDQALHAWGVFDALAVTDFPDIRTKCAIQSHKGGSILLIPREGGYLFRMYVDLGVVSPEDRGRVRDTTLDEIIATANRILYPYSLDVRHVTWHSIYEVGHRLADSFDDVPTAVAQSTDPRVFIAGDACHTHSAKAGQGMNVSMQDGFNLAWKLGHVLEGRAPASLLATYSAERWVVAKNLIDFDKEWSSLMAAKPEELADRGELESFYTKTFEFPAGFMTQYAPSIVMGTSEHQRLAIGFPVGKRFKSAWVTRVCDAKPVHLGHHARADGRWRLYVFADALTTGGGTRVTQFARWLSASPESPLLSTPHQLDLDAWIDVKVIYQEEYRRVELNEIPGVFLPRTGPFALVDYEKVYAAAADDDVFALRGVDRGGVLVLVRPDQYVANVLPLSATQELAAFLNPLLRAAGRAPRPASADHGINIPVGAVRGIDHS